MAKRIREITDPKKIEEILNGCEYLHLGLVDDVEEKKRSLSALMRTQTGEEFTFDDKMASIVVKTLINNLCFAQ